MKANNSQYFPALTGIRTVAAYMVCLFHFTPKVPDGNGHLSLVNWMNELHVGVTVFFVLSGFLIGFRYFDQAEIDFRNYMANRIARIYPVYFLLTTLFFVHQFWIAKQGAGSTLFGTYFLNITFLKGFSDQFKFSGIVQGWSLTVEETFYLLAPFLFVLLKRTKWNFLLLPSMLLALGLGLSLLLGDLPNQRFFGNISFMLSYTFFGRAFEFFVGIFLSRLFLRNRQEVNRSKFAYTIAGCAGIGACITWISLFHYDQQLGIDTLSGKVINNFILPVAGVALLLWGLLTERTWLQRLLSTKLFVLLGKSSYAFYLIHMGLIYNWISGISELPIVKFVLLNLISVFIFLVVEEPLNKRLRPLLQRRVSVAK